jgi:hypothetical protein
MTYPPPPPARSVHDDIREINRKLDRLIEVQTKTSQTVAVHNAVCDADRIALHAQGVRLWHLVLAIVGTGTVSGGVVASLSSVLTP